MSIKILLKKILYKILDFQPFLYRPDCKIFDHKFEIHKTDVDMWPSFPHMHSIEDNLVLDIYSGKVYRKITRDLISNAREKDMVRLWNDRKFLKNIVEIRKNKPLNLEKLEPIPIKWLNEENLKWMEQNERIIK